MNYIKIFTCGGLNGIWTSTSSNLKLSTCTHSRSQCTCWTLTLLHMLTLWHITTKDPTPRPCSQFFHAPGTTFCRQASTMLSASQQIYFTSKLGVSVAEQALMQGWQGLDLSATILKDAADTCWFSGFWNIQCNVLINFGETLEKFWRNFQDTLEKEIWLKTIFCRTFPGCEH